jgi:hypothetical protein
MRSTLGLFYIGVDLGQKHDHTAIAIIERESARHVNTRTLFAPLKPQMPKLFVRRVERIALGTPYPRIAERIRQITHEPLLAGRCALAIDATGLGAPVVDMLREPGLGCEMLAVTITGGTRESRQGMMQIGVPRRDLISGVQLLLEKECLRIARHMPESGALFRELLAMRTDRDTAEHDDLVLALALACWRARRKSVYAAGRLPGF